MALCVDHFAEGVKVVKQRGGVVDMEARAGDLLVCGGDVFIAKKDEMGKQT